MIQQFIQPGHMIGLLTDPKGSISVQLLDDSLMNFLSLPLIKAPCSDKRYQVETLRQSLPDYLD